MENKRAFSLIELLVTITIIVVLAALVIPTAMSARRSAQDAQSLSNLRQIGTALSAFVGENNGSIMPRAYASTTMTVNGLLFPTARPFYKKGAGTLYLASGTGTNADNSLRNGTSINIDEGTLEIGNAAQFEPGSTLASLAVHIGTATTTATLKGGGSFVGIAGKPVTLTTYGSAHSIIEPAGDGTLAIQNLNASSGATFRFDLGSDLIFGTGTLTGSLLAGGLALDLSGGAAGVTYTLFDYGTLSGVDASDFAIGTEGYTVEFWNINNGLVQVQFSAVPEPGNYAAFGLLLLVAFLIKKERQKALNS